MAENNLNDQDILLVKEKSSDRLKALASVDGNGKIETVEATAENAGRFLKFDRNEPKELAGIMAAFNKDPDNADDFRLYRARYGKFEKDRDGLEEVLSLPRDSEGRNVLKLYEVEPGKFATGQYDDTARTVLLVRDENGRMKVVTGVDEAGGKLKTAAPIKENAPAFLQFDTNGNALENFFKRFSEQARHPSHTGIYAVTARAATKVAAFFERVLNNNPDDAVLDPYRLTDEGKKKEPAPDRYQPLDLNRLNWSQTEQMGLSGDDLSGILRQMAFGHKSKGMLNVSIEVDGQEITSRARLSLVERPDGSLEIQQHPWQAKPDFDKPFMGVEFTDEDIKQFQLTGNGGRVFELVTPDGELVPSLVSLDRQTNRFEAVPLSEINIPPVLKGVELSQEQQDKMLAGDMVLVENMDKRVKPGEEDTGEKITRFVQYNAAEGSFDFIFTPEQQEKYRQERAARQVAAAEGPDGQPLKARQMDGIWVRPVQGGVALSPEQFNKVCAGEAVYVTGLTSSNNRAKSGAAQKVGATDNKGEKYDAWVWIDPQMGRVRHTTNHPEKQRAIDAKRAAGQGQGKPAAGYETQVAVNSNGKTNEATKHAQRDGKPMKQGQTSENQQRTIQAPRKGGHKM